MLNSTTDTLNLKAEAVLDPSIQFQQPLSKNLKAPKFIFLTGATGFLGAYLLDELLRKTTANIYCLIRSSDAESGKQRLKNHLQFYSLWEETLSSRIIPVIGDLSLPLFGLSEQQFHELAEQIDIIYHNGAWVNAACPYLTLKPTNVLSTQEVLRLASLIQTKPVHFISTIGVFFSEAYSAVQQVTEIDLPEFSSLKGGYRQSKWVAEQLVMIAQERGLPACIYRPSRIMGHSKTGINGNFQDALCLLLKGCIQLKKFPSVETDIILVPVDYVSQSIVHLSLLEKSPGKAFHLTNSQPTSWENLFDAICSVGYPLEKVTYNEFLVAVEHHAFKHPEDEYNSSLLLLLSSSETFPIEKPKFDARHTQAGLAGTSIACPPVDEKLLATYFSYFQKVGYLPSVPKKFTPTTSSVAPTNQTQPTKKSSAFWKSITTSIKAKNQAFVIQPVPRNGNLPLSFAQERLWLLDQLQPGNPVHNLRAAYRLKGLLNVEALEQSIQEIVRRHEVLRTTFPAVNGEPIQVISNNLTLELQIVNLAELSTQQREAEVRRLATVADQEPFDLAHGPLLRVKLLYLAEDEYVLLRIIHHIINDVWSDTVFMRELATLYATFCAGKPSPLPELPIQYSDFAQSQRQWLQGEVLKSQLDYWKPQLGDPLSILKLPTDYSLATLPSYQGASQFLILSRNLTDSLKALGHQEGVSLFVTMLAAFKTLLYQYSRQQEIILCSPVAGRQQPETKKLIGYFNNLVLLRTNLGQNPSFRELMSRVSRVTLEAQEHQYLPFQYLGSSVGVPGTILSRAMFTMQNVLSQPQELAGVSVSLMEMEEGISNFDVSLSVKEKGEQLMGVMRYKTDLFKESTIAQMLENFQILLQDIVANPHRRLLDLPLLGEAKSPQLFDEPQAAAYVAPQNEIEQAIATIWQEVLGLETVSIHSNFFDVGGRSLSTIRVYHKVREICARQISVAELFKSPTISGMAQVLSN
ncbi:thioester reductase domain-containing protein [Scytonema sp. NUACC26]|uniref:thioester reductase domain-containing protein n=1 Tax=Scytonema sp. NUACC26 TaxID=3140176 RepID=UPI0034DBD3F2